MARLKDMISAPGQLINEKNKPRVNLPVYAFLITVANSKRPVHSDEDDRHYAVSEVAGKLAEDEVIEIREWIDNGGAELVKGFLLGIKNLDRHHEPFKRPPMSAATRDVVDRGLTPLRRWARR
jgi:hypothetical protein